MKSLFKTFVLFITVVFITTCSGGSDSSTPEPTPTPSVLDLDLDGAFNYGMADGKFTQGITIYHQGNIIRDSFRGILPTEESFALSGGTYTMPQELVDEYKNRDRFSLTTSWSTGKSFTSILIGVAIDLGYISDLDQKASDFIFEWENDARSEITIRQLMDMRSGLIRYEGGYGGNITIYPDQLSVCIDRPLREPADNDFIYNNCDSMVLGEIVERSSGRDFYEFADIYLFSKLDIDAQWWTDQSGNYLSYCCVDTTQEDFLKFGIMLLNNGGDVVSSSFINEILANNGEEYNLQFWFRDGMVTTIGYDGQYIAVDFSNNLIATRNSLYYQYVPVNGQIIMINNNFGVNDQLQIPFTLPSIIGGSQAFDMSTFLSILYKN